MLTGNVMHKLKLRPTQAGYSVQPGSNVLMQQLDGGAPRFGVFTKKSSHQVNVQWVVNKAGYQYLFAFYHVWLRNPAQPFLVDLVIDGEATLQQYQCFFMPASFQLNSKVGVAHMVSAQLIAKAINRNTAIDDLIVNVGDEGVLLAELLSPLEHLVNHALPDALESFKD